MSSLDTGEHPGGSEVDRVDVYLDDGDEPIATYSPPARIQFDTTALEDGQHRLRIEATGPEGSVGRRIVDFEVRNGPAIDVEGLNSGDTVSDEVDLMVHAWGGAGREDWEASHAESPAPAPTWAWVLLIVVFAWALFYAVSYWQPTEEFTDTPTYPAVEGRP
ncbi:MAG: cytochrome C [Bradymonadaceae bacterium]